MYRVTVSPDYRWNDAQVAGRIFSKKAVTEIGEAAMVPEILNSPILVVEAVDTPVPPEQPAVEAPERAEPAPVDTPGAVKPARRAK